MFLAFCRWELADAQKKVVDDFTCTGSRFQASNKLQTSLMQTSYISFLIKISLRTLRRSTFRRCFNCPGNVCSTAELSQKYTLDLPHLPLPFHLGAQTAIRTSRVTKTSKKPHEDSLRALTHRISTFGLSKDRSLQLSSGQGDRRSIYTTRGGHRHRRYLESSRVVLEADGRRKGRYLARKKGCIVT